MPRTKSSQRWLKEHEDDPYVKRARKEGYRSRAVYKLKEIDDREHIFKSGMLVLDLGAAPGGWSQYVTKKIGPKGIVIALDCLAITPIPGVVTIQGRFEDEAIWHALRSQLPRDRVDVLLSDMAPNTSGQESVDMPKAMFLCELALDAAKDILMPGGTLVMKVFHGEGFDALVKDMRQSFSRVVIKKPAASRPRSRETYILARGYTSSLVKVFPET